MIKSSTPLPATAEEAAVPKYAFSLARYGGDESTLSFEFIVGLLLAGRHHCLLSLCTQISLCWIDNLEVELRQLNPLLTTATVKRISDLAADVLMRTNRMGQARGCLVSSLRSNTCIGC